MSISEYIFRRSCMTQSRYSSPVPRITCSPDSSTWKRNEGFSWQPPCSQLLPSRRLLKSEEGSALNTLVQSQNTLRKAPTAFSRRKCCWALQKAASLAQQGVCFSAGFTLFCYFYIIYEINCNTMKRPTTNVITYSKKPDYFEDQPRGCPSTGWKQPHTRRITEQLRLEGTSGNHLIQVPPAVP